MATVNCTVTGAHIETHPTTGAKSLHIRMTGATGATAVTTESGKHADHTTTPSVPSAVGVTVAVTVDDGTGEVTAISYTAA